MSVATLPMPTIDAVQARTAAAELADLISRFGPDSVVGQVLTHARRELQSLARSAPAGTVSGPHRLTIAA